MTKTVCPVGMIWCSINYLQTDIRYSVKLMTKLYRTGWIPSYITRNDGAKKHLFDFHTELVTRVSTKNESWSSYVTRNATVLFRVTSLLWTYPGFVVVLGLK